MFASSNDDLYSIFNTLVIIANNVTSGYQHDAQSKKNSKGANAAVLSNVNTHSLLNVN
jgi:hypothetical protein